MSIQGYDYKEFNSLILKRLFKLRNDSQYLNIQAKIFDYFIECHQQCFGISDAIFPLKSQDFNENVQQSQMQMSNNYSANQSNVLLRKEPQYQELRTIPGPLTLPRVNGISNLIQLVSRGVTDQEQLQALKTQIRDLLEQGQLNINFASLASEEEFATLALNESIQPITWLSFKRLIEIQLNSEITNVLALIQYLTFNYRDKLYKEKRIRDLIIEQDDNKLKLLWENFLQTWNAQTPAEEQQSPILFDDGALLSYFVSIDDEERFLSLEDCLRLLNFLAANQTVTPLLNQNINYNGDQIKEQQVSTQQKNVDDTQNQQNPTAATTFNISDVEKTATNNLIQPNKAAKSQISGQKRSVSEGEPYIGSLDIPFLNQDEDLFQKRALNRSTIDSDNIFKLFNFLAVLEIDNSKQKSRKITSLRELLNTANPVPNVDLKSYMKQFRQYTKDVLFGDNKQKRKLHQIQIEWAPFSDELLTSLVLALSDRLPSNNYGEAIATEISRLESIGESIMEHVYVVYAITNPPQYGLHFNDLENLRIQSLKITNLSDLARLFYLDAKLLTNQQVQSDAPHRELWAIVHSIVGALGLWAGLEPVIHFLQLLNVIQKSSKMQKMDPKEEVKEGGGSHSGSLGKTGEEEVAAFFEEKKGNESIKNEDDIVEAASLDEEKEAKYFHTNQDWMMPGQLYQYGYRLQNSPEINQIMKSLPIIDEIEKKVAMIVSSNKSTQLKKEQSIIFKLPFFDSSFNDSRFMETEIGKTNEFLRGNLSNLKLKMIGQAFITMMFKVSMYYETADLTTQLEFKSAKHIDAQICQIMLASWHCYGITTKFATISSLKGNLIPIVTSPSNKQLMDKITEYEKLVRPTYIIPANEIQVQEFAQSQTSTQASSQQQQQYSLKTYTYNSKDYSKLYQDEKKEKLYRQFFTSKPSDKMSEIAENFVPEYATVLQALIGANFIQTIGNLKKTSEFAQFLLMLNKDNRFPIFKEMKSFYSNLWNANPYSRILKLHYSVEHIKSLEKEKMLYYKVYIQTLEIRRVKFKASHSSRHQRIFKDVQQYIEVGNKVFQEFQKKVKFPLSPYEYITFHQEYRKIYKVGASFDILYKSMEPFYSKRKLTENNPLQRIQTFLTNIKRIKQRNKVSSNYTMTQKIIEQLANQIEADLKQDNCRAIDNVLTGQKDLQIMDYIDLAINLLIELKQQSVSTTIDQQEQNQQAYEQILEELSKEMQITRFSHGHIFNDEHDQRSESSLNTASFNSKQFLSSRTTNEEVLRLLEHVSEQCIQ